MNEWKKEEQEIPRRILLLHWWQTIASSNYFTCIMEHNTTQHKSKIILKGRKKDKLNLMSFLADESNWKEGATNHERVHRGRSSGYYTSTIHSIELNRCTDRTSFIQLGPYIDCVTSSHIWFPITGIKQYKMAFTNNNNNNNDNKRSFLWKDGSLSIYCMGHINKESIEFIFSTVNFLLLAFYCIPLAHLI